MHRKRFDMNQPKNKNDRIMLPTLEFGSLRKQNLSNLRTILYEKGDFYKDTVYSLLRLPGSLMVQNNPEIHIFRLCHYQHK